MQDQSNRLSLGANEALRAGLIGFRPFMAALLGPDFGPLVGHRSESWSIHHWRARSSDANPDWRIVLPPSEICAAENNQHGKAKC